MSQDLNISLWRIVVGAFRYWWSNGRAMAILEELNETRTRAMHQQHVMLMQYRRIIYDARDLLAAGRADETARYVGGIVEYWESRK